MHNWALIGYGGMGGWHVGNIRKSLPEINIKGVWDIREEARSEAGANGLYVYPSLEALLADGEVEFVTVATPNDFHRPLAEKCMRAGKHVISEKPATIRSSEVEELIGVSKETGKIYTVHQNRRWDKDFLIVKKVLSSGVIGAPFFIESRMHSNLGARFNWRARAENGGGMLLDWGVHLIDQLMFMLDSPVVGVDARLVGVFSDVIDDSSKIVLRFENGVMATVEVATNSFIKMPRWHVSCAGGTLMMDDFGTKGRLVKARGGLDPDAEYDLIYTDEGAVKLPPKKMKRWGEELPLPIPEGEWPDLYRNVMAAMEGRAELIVKPEQVLRVMKVIDLAFQSEREGRGLSCRV